MDNLDFLNIYIIVAGILSILTMTITVITERNNQIKLGVFGYGAITAIICSLCWPVVIIGTIIFAILWVFRTIISMGEK